MTPPALARMSGTLFLLVTAVLAAPWARRVRASDLLLAGAGVVLMLYAVRDIPIFAVLVLPLWSDGVHGFFNELATARRLRPVRRRPAPAWFVAAVLIIVSLAAGARMVDQLHSPKNELMGSAYPVAVGRVICDGPPARVFAPYGSSGWLLYRIDHRVAAGRHCAPDRVFIFGEVVLMGRQILSQYLTAVSGGAGSLAVLRQHRVNLVWQPRGAPLSTLLLRTRGWRCVFATSSNMLLATTASAPAWHSSRAGCPG